ncbi:SLC13 family permease [Rossellomorea sp. H39__3]
MKKLYDVEISFAQWMLFGIPLVVVLIPLVWFYLTKIAYPIRIKQLSGGKEVIKNEQQSLGRMGYEEKVVLTIFTLTALAWITRSFFLSTFIPGIDDTVIALIAAFALFIIPAKTQSGSIMDWETAKKLPWGSCGYSVGTGDCSRHHQLRTCSMDRGASGQFHGSTRVAHTASHHQYHHSAN